MFDKVLMPIDLNHPESWEKALPMARRLTGESGELILLAIVHDLGAATIASFLPKDFEVQALQKAKADLDAFIAREIGGAGARVSGRVDHGHVPEHILKSAAETGADVIVMASAPVDEMRSFLVGSNADKVVRHADRPVLVVR